MKQRIPPFAVVSLIAVLLAACGTSSPSASATATPPSAAAAAVAGPQLGATMAWVDGSTLVYVPLSQSQQFSPCNASGLCDARLDLASASDRSQTGSAGGFWVTLNAISNYQFSLCVQSGDCKPPSGPDYSDSSREMDPVGIVDPMRSAYCAWMSGRVPTQAESARLGDGSVRGALSNVDFTGGLHCIVDNPRPRPLFARTSPYYDPSTSMAGMLAKVTDTQTSCQNGQGVERLALALPAGHALQAPKGASGVSCGLVDSTHIVCTGPSNASQQVPVGLVCNGHGVFDCQPGSTLEARGCQNNMHSGPIQGMDDWERDANGALAPVHGIQLPNGGFTGPITHPFHLLNGVMVAQSISSNSLPTNGLSTNGLSTNGLSGNGIPGNALPGNGSNANGSPANGFLVPAVCPVGFYLDGGAGVCASLGASVPTCLDGYSFDDATQTCKSAASSGNYPGCPAGQLFDPSTASCDANTTIVSATQLNHTQLIQFNLPDCTKPQKDPTCKPGPYTKCP